MCGISGWQIDSSLISKFKGKSTTLINALSHRGPDNKGEYHNNKASVFLGHNRLSIIDLSDLANQPMQTESGDVMVLNGEIYNYQILKKQLISCGHKFHSESDSEVLLKSFVEWGVNCFNKLNGMYAVAIWSERDQTLHLARDPLGIKPLYYWQVPNNKGIVFASELRVFLGLPEFKASIDKNSLQQFIEFGYTFDDTHTIFKNIYKVQPGHRLEIRKGKISKTKQFYIPNTQISSENKEELEDRLYETLTTVVKEQLVADVPVGLLLSGGLDSSLIAAIASKYEKVHTFSMGFADSNVDERPFARIVSDHIGSLHKEVLIQPDEIMQDLESVVSHYDDLFADWGMISTRLLYKKCRDQGVKVVLVGEGSDELFGGYGVFNHGLSKHNNKLMEWRLFQLYRSYAGRRYGRQYLNFRSIMKNYISICNGDLFSAIRMFESRNQLPNNYVMKVDKASMSLSLEARTPFLDSRIADIAYQIPCEMLVNNSDEKMILKSIASRHNLLPDEIINRRKFGAGIASNWMDESEEFRNFAREIILSKNSWVDKLELRDAMERYFNHAEKGYAFPKAISIFSNLSWRLLLLNLWGKSLGINA